MVKAEELRIGNYVYDGMTDKKVVQVSEIRQMPDDENDNMSICHYDEHRNYCTTSLEENEEQEESEFIIQPIPLTEDKLLSLGFTTYKDYGEFEKGIIELKYCVEGCWSLYYYKHQISTEVEYVHQLQNLYYELTGEELKLK